MNIPDGFYYSKEHEWVKIEKDTARIGLTDYAQSSLGDITFVELPRIPGRIEQFKILATIESVKAASDIYAPVSGEIIEINAALENNPGLVNSSPYEEGWIAKIRFTLSDETKNLMDANAYKTYCQGLSH